MTSKTPIKYYSHVHPQVLATWNDQFHAFETQLYVQLKLVR